MAILDTREFARQQGELEDQLLLRVRRWRLPESFVNQKTYSESKGFDP
jgi:hypothetical protein